MTTNGFFMLVQRLGFGGIADVTQAAETEGIIVLRA